MVRCLLSFFLLSISLVSSMGVQLYSVTDMGVFSGGSFFSGNAVNDSGEVVGFYNNGSANHPFLWTVGGGMVDLGTLGGTQAYAQNISNSGIIVGRSNTTGDTAQHAFSYSGGVMTDLDPALGNTGFSSAMGINSNGDIVGETATGGYLYSGGVLTYLPLMPGGTWVAPRVINDAGMIAGSGDHDVTGYERTFLYSGGVTTDLGDAPGGTFSNMAYGINASGDIAGYTFDGLDGGIANYGGVPGGTIRIWNGWAIGISDAGDIIGSNYSIDTLLYSGGVTYDLNTLLDSSGAGWVLDAAHAMSHNGLIFGSGTFGGVQHAFLLTPVPEPSTWISLGTGILLLGAQIRHRKSAK